MEQLTKARVQAFVVGAVLGLIVFGLVMYLREHKFVNKATGRYLWCRGNHYVYVSLKNPPAPQGSFPDTFEICRNDTVTWAPSSGEPITKFVIDFDGGETPFLNSSGSGPDQGHFEWSNQPGGPDHVTTGAAKNPCLSGACTYVFFGSKYFKYIITITDSSGHEYPPFDPGGRIWK
jgi:hypothetical protein